MLQISRDEMSGWEDHLSFFLPFSFQSMLPRESLSKETDAALLTVVGYPAFAVDKEEIIEDTLRAIVTKLGGSYGCKRFLRDGYKNPREVREKSNVSISIIFTNEPVSSLPASSAYTLQKACFLV